MPGFLSIERISQGPWQALERGIQRLLIHSGFDDVRLVGGTGDGGGDVVANLKQRTWVIQSKYRSGGQVLGAKVLDEVAPAIGKYGAEVAVVATNASVSKDAIERAKRLEMDVGTRILLWDGKFLLERFRKLQEYANRRNEPRPYQEQAIGSGKFQDHVRWTPGIVVDGNWPG